MIRYVPPPAAAGGVEVMSIAELHQRMRGHGADGAGHLQRPEFHLLLTVTAGELRHMVDFADYTVTEGTWLWVRPGQVQRFGDLRTARGTLVLFQPDVLDAATAADVRLDDPFGRTRWPAGSEDNLALGHLAQEYRSASLPDHCRTAILQRLLAVLLLRLTQAVGVPTAGHGDTFQRFRSAVERHYAQARDVGHYARTLGYAPRTLTRAALDAAGVGAKEFIDRRVVLEAKRLLAHGDEPVARVAARLGFLDASNFVKYFSQRTEVTPAAFRSQFRLG